MPKFIALTRDVSDSINECELTHVFREPIDVARARAQHAAYERALEAAGCEIVRAEPAHDLPDAVFVEDAAIVVDDVAIRARPGAASRRPEVDGVVDVLRRYRDVLSIDAPSTIDGGDVVIAGRRVFIGRTSRTDGTAIVKVRSILARIGYSVEPVRITGCLHLKSAATALADDRLLINPAWVRPDAFAGLDVVEIDPSESFGANVVRAGGRLIYPEAFPRTRERLEGLGFQVDAVDVSELAKAEGAVTCCSVVFSS